MKSSAFGLSLLLASSLLLAQSNPVPFVNQPLVPSAVAPGGPMFILTVNGTGFVSGSTVNWNGAVLATTFVSSSQLTATIPAANIANASTASITVSSPTPGGGTSGALFLPVSNPTSLQFTSFSDAAELGAAPPVVADFNGDGKLDFAVPEGFGFEDYPLNLLIGNGEGTFQSLFKIDIGINLSSFGIGDFNSDGKLDLAGKICGDDLACYLNVFLGNGDGTFSPEPSVLTPIYPIVGIPMIGDFNGDGELDVAFIGSNFGLCVYLGNGDGTLQSPVISDPATPDSALLAVGDFNRDGKLDLIGIDYSNNEIAFFAGNGDGTFQTPSTSYTLGNGTGGAIAADLNGDGILDLVTAQGDPANTYTILLGNGDGTFNSQPPISTSNFLQPGSPTVADMNADGKLDLILSSLLSSSPTTLVLPGNGDGTFQTPVETSYYSTYTSAGDFNNDGKLDLVVTPESYLLQEVPVSSASPTSLTFRTQTVGGKSAAQITTLSNSGSAILSLTSFGFTGANASDFVQTNTCGSMLAVSGSCQISVTFTPSAAGSRYATLSVANNGIDTNPTSITLAGTGYVQPSPPSLSPATITFPGQYVGTSGLPQSVSLQNPSGNGMLSIANVTASPSSDFAVVNSCGNSVVDGGSCAIAVFFDPSASGTRTGTLTVTDNASSSPQTVALMGAGEDFSMSGDSLTATVSPGQTASFGLTVASAGGFSQKVTFICTGAPSLSTCSVSPTSMTLSGTSASKVAVTVTTAASSGVAPRMLSGPPSNRTLTVLLGTLGLLALTAWAGSRRSLVRRFVPYGFALLVLLTASTMPGCAGSSHNGSGETPTGSYNLTITGTFTSGSTTLTHTTKLTLNVQRVD